MSLCSNQASRLATTSRCILQGCFRRHSHVGARPIPIPSDVACTLHKAAASTSSGAEETMLRFTGPLGVRELRLPSGVSPVLQTASTSTGNNTTSKTTSKADSVESTSAAAASLIMQCSDPSSASTRSNWGLTAALAANCVQGVHQGFDMNLQLIGVGYRASVEDQDTKQTTSAQAESSQQTLVLRLGYPRPLRIPIPAGMRCEVSAPTQIKLSGNDKASLAQLAAKIRSLRPPEPYNGKGVFVNNETIRRKEVKKK